MTDRRKVSKKPHHDDIPDLAYKVLVFAMIGGFLVSALVSFFMG